MVASAHGDHQQVVSQGRKQERGVQNSEHQQADSPEFPEESQQDGAHVFHSCGKVHVKRQTAAYHYVLERDRANTPIQKDLPPGRARWY